MKWNGRDWGSGTGTTAAGQAALLRADGSVRRVVRAVVGGGRPVLGAGRGDHVGGGAGHSAGGGDRGQPGQRGGPEGALIRRLSAVLLRGVGLAELNEARAGQDREGGGCQAGGAGREDVARGE